MLYSSVYNTPTFGLKCAYDECINSWNKLTSDINIKEKKKYANKLNTPHIDFLKIPRTAMIRKITLHILSPGLLICLLYCIPLYVSVLDKPMSSIILLCFNAFHANLRVESSDSQFCSGHTVC